MFQNVQGILLLFLPIFSTKTKQLILRRSFFILKISSKSSSGRRRLFQFGTVNQEEQFKRHPVPLRLLTHPVSRCCSQVQSARLTSQSTWSCRRSTAPSTASGQAIFLQMFVINGVCGSSMQILFRVNVEVVRQSRQLTRRSDIQYNTI